jgi:hypothetical protein
MATKKKAVSKSASKKSLTGGSVNDTPLPDLKGGGGPKGGGKSSGAAVKKK